MRRCLREGLQLAWRQYGQQDRFRQTDDDEAAAELHGLELLLNEKLASDRIIFHVEDKMSIHS